MSYLRQISPMQILLLLVLTVALYFVVAFAGELLTNQRIDRQTASLSADIGRLRTENQQLRTQVAAAHTNGFVEQEARDRLGLIQPGDTPVVVVNAPAPSPPPPPPTPTPAPHWQHWAETLGLTSH